jgi:hypothetical protein
VLVEVVCLPVTYAVIRAVKRREPGYGDVGGADRTALTAPDA